MAEHVNRRISNGDHNIYVKYGIDAHKSTSVAPTSHFRSTSKDTHESFTEKFDEVSSKLEKIFGLPYFKDDGFILYNGDCTEYLKVLRENQIITDLTITSPPYNIGKEYENQMSVGQYVEWCSEWMELIFDVTKHDGSFWLNLGYFEVPDKGLCVPISYLLWDKSRFYLLQEVVWKYGAGVSTKKRLSPRNEKWLFYIKNKDKYTFNLDDIRDPNVKYPNQKKNGKFRCNPLGKNPSDVWDVSKVTSGKNRSSRERTNHPAQFPLKVIERIILASSQTGDIIIDPFAGSCSVGISANGHKRIFVGFEINQDYCDMAVRRYEGFKKELEESQRQGTLSLL